MGYGDVMKEHPTDLIRDAENALTDYIDTLEKQGASLNYGRSVLKRLRAYLERANNRPDTGTDTKW